MWKQNQIHEQLYRPFPFENPQCRAHDGLSLDSNCICPPCRTRPDKIEKQITIDKDLELLKEKKRLDKASKQSDLIIFLNQLNKNSSKGVPNIGMLDTIVFSQGSVKYIVNCENRLKIIKLTMSLKNYIIERKQMIDLQFQKKKHQRQNFGFSFTQLDHQSQKYIKQFENKIKFMNPLLNRIVIAKSFDQQEEQILTQNEISLIFSRISRKIYDFTHMQYIQIFPIMYGFEQLSYIKCIKYFRQREISKKNYKIAEHYVGSWYSKNSTLENMELQFLETIKNNEQQLLMYYTYKLFIFFQKTCNKMVECALVSYITNDEGNSFSLKNIQYLKLYSLHEVEERILELPQKLEKYEPEDKIDLKKEMRKNFDSFQLNYDRLEKQRRQMEQKRQSDIDFSNKVYQSLGYNIPKGNKSFSFIRSIQQEYSIENKGKIKIQSSEKSIQI